MNPTLPPLRALQAFECFGRLGSVNAAARALGVTPGAISQQLRLLEEHVGVVLLVKDGRRAALTPVARSYHELLSQGFSRLALAQDYIVAHRQSEELTISGLPTLLQKWLNPLLPEFQQAAGELEIRVLATHQEPDPHMLEQAFRLTYGAAARRYLHARALFTDQCFPVCSPDFLRRHPEARDPAGLARLPLIGIDWGTGYTTEPDWRDWFAARGLGDLAAIRPVAVHSLSGMAIEAAEAGQGAVLAQGSFVETPLRTGQLVRLSPASLQMPDPYFVCWGPATLDRPAARDFLNWLVRICKPLRNATLQNN
ncbi:LysR substrate-binding domain-containing protein [Paracoccus sp. (in: a-proteobacteria)]|uniref:LysR substrate-binding domain-containing protein n=1 Tax=Paracoccus sp. TaxID=267 RepID=UPI00321F83F8